LAGAGLERHEAELLVEGDRIWLGVDNHASATKVVRHRVREREYGLQERRSDAASLSRFFGCESCQAQDREGIPREPPSVSLGNVIGCYLRRRDRREAEHGSVFDRDVGRADVVTELVLAGEALEEAIEVDVPSKNTLDPSLRTSSRQGKACNRPPLREPDLVVSHSWE
jgi:hypothetical protein